MFKLLARKLRSAAGKLRPPILPWPLALLLVVLVHAVSAYCLVDLRFDNSAAAYYPKDSPAVRLRAEMRRHFPGDEVMTVVFHGSDLYTPAFLQRLDRMAAQVNRSPLVDRALTITTLERVQATRDGFAVGKVVDLSARKPASPEQLRQRVLADRFAPGALASRDGQYLAMVVRPKGIDDSGQRLALSIAVHSAINEAGLRTYYAGEAGPIPHDVAQLQSILRDTATFLPLTVGVALLLLWWVVGRWRPVVIGGLAMSTVVLPAVAVIALWGQPYTMATAIIPSLLAAYTSATLLHYYAAIQRAHAAHLSRRRSVDRALADTFVPGIYNVLTTAAGLLSLLLVPIPPIQVFGAIGALGTALVFITVYLLVPSFLRHWDHRRWPVRDSGLGRFGRVAPHIALFSMRHHRLVIAGAVILMLACLPIVRKVSVESDLLAFFQPNHPVNVQTRLVEQKFAGVTSVEVSIKGDGPESLQDLTTLRLIRDLQRWLEQQPEIDRTVSMVDLIEEMHWAMNGEKPAFRTLPGNERLLRQYLLIYDGNDLYEVVDREFGRARIALSVNVHGTTAVGALIERIRGRFKSQPIPGVELDVAGEGRLFVDQSDLLVSGQLNSFAGAFLQIFLFMAVLWRSLSAAALCMVPNLAPLYFVFALMGGLAIHIDVATIMIAGVVLGITVDDTIHLYHGYRHRLAKGMSPVFAISRSFESTGTAVLSISVLLISQFAMLYTSDFVPTSNFGIMTAIGLFSGQAFELLLLPALLLLKDGRKPPRAAAHDDPSGHDDPTSTRP